MSELAVRVVCARGDWHENGKSRVLATFVRDDNQVTADYWENGCGWRAERPSSIDPYRDQEASLQKRAGAFRESMPVTFDTQATYLDCEQCKYLTFDQLGVPGNWEDPKVGHGPNCARWSAVCKCGWPTWNVPVRLMAPLLENAASEDRDVSAEEIEAVAEGFSGTTWTDDRLPHGGMEAPSDATVIDYLRAADTHTLSATGGLDSLAPGTRGLVPDGIIVMLDRNSEHETSHRKPAIRVATIALNPQRNWGKSGIAFGNGWVVVEGVELDTGGYRFTAAGQVGAPFTLAQLGAACDALREEGVRSVALGDMLPKVLMG